MNGQQCSVDENVVRAVRTSDWDPDKKRWSSDLFRGPEASVSRLVILPLPEIFRIFFADLHKPPVHRVIKAGEIGVGDIKALGQAYVENKKNKPIGITVVPDPIKNHEKYTDNPAHALVKEKLPRSLALTIIDNLSFHEAPSFWRRFGWGFTRLFIKLD